MLRVSGCGQCLVSNGLVLFTQSAGGEECVGTVECINSRMCSVYQGVLFSEVPLYIEMYMYIHVHLTCTMYMYVHVHVAAFDGSKAIHYQVLAFEHLKLTIDPTKTECS